MCTSISEFVGVWELDPETLLYQSGRPGRRAIYSIREIPGGVEFNLDADDADGKPMNVSYGGQLDGREVTLPGLALTLALNQLPDGSIESVARKDGVVVDRWTRTLSADRESMIIRQHGVDLAGKAFVNSGVYRRVGAGSKVPG